MLAKRPSLITLPLRLRRPRSNFQVTRGTALTTLTSSHDQDPDGDFQVPSTDVRVSVSVHLSKSSSPHLALQNGQTSRSLTTFTSPRDHKTGSNSSSRAPTPTLFHSRVARSKLTGAKRSPSYGQTTTQDRRFPHTDNLGINYHLRPSTTSGTLHPLSVRSIAASRIAIIRSAANGSRRRRRQRRRKGAHRRIFPNKDSDLATTLYLLSSASNGVHLPSPSRICSNGSYRGS